LIYSPRNKPAKRQAGSWAAVMPFGKFHSSPRFLIAGTYNKNSSL
jgi:hypothetical protein